MPARDVRIGEADVAVLRPADDDAALVDLVLGAVRLERDHLGLDAELLGRDCFGRAAWLGFVDHRRAGLGLRDRRCLTGLRLNHPCRDPELADLEVGVGVHHDLRSAQQDVRLAARVLAQVLLELGEQRLLVGLELLAVGRREVDRVLVGRVDARDGDHAVVVHLLGQLARELDGLDVRAERPAEDALEQRLDLLLDIAKDSHGRRGSTRRRVYRAPACPNRCDWRDNRGHRGPPAGFSLSRKCARVSAQIVRKLRL